MIKVEIKLRFQVHQENSSLISLFYIRISNHYDVFINKNKDR